MHAGKQKRHFCYLIANTVWKISLKQSSCLINSIDFYAPPTIVEGHYVFWSVRPSVYSSVRPFVPLHVKVFGQGSFWWIWSPINLKHSTHVPFDVIFLIFKTHKTFDPQFHGPLNIENESASFRLKFLVKVVFDEVQIQSTWNLVHMFHMVWSF